MTSKQVTQLVMFDSASNLFAHTFLLIKIVHICFHYYSNSSHWCFTIV